MFAPSGAPWRLDVGFWPCLRRVFSKQAAIAPVPRDRQGVCFSFYAIVILRWRVSRQNRDPKKRAPMLSTDAQVQGGVHSGLHHLGENWSKGRYPPPPRPSPPPLGNSPIPTDRLVTDRPTYPPFVSRRRRALGDLIYTWGKPGKGPASGGSLTQCRAIISGSAKWLRGFKSARPEWIAIEH